MSEDLRPCQASHLNMPGTAAYIVVLCWSHPHVCCQSKHPTMLETIAVLFVILWLLGIVTSYTLGGLIHLLLVIAVVSIILRLISGRRV